MFSQLIIGNGISFNLAIGQTPTTEQVKVLQKNQTSADSFPKSYMS
jgi:hypothetical protein